MPSAISNAFFSTSVILSALFRLTDLTLRSTASKFYLFLIYYISSDSCTLLNQDSSYFFISYFLLIGGKQYPDFGTTLSTPFFLRACFFNLSNSFIALICASVTVSVGELFAYSTYALIFEILFFITSNRYE